jgi:phage shock protein E
MLNKIKQVLGFGPKVDYIKLVEEGALLLDVRSTREFANGHIPGSLNISLDTLGNKLGQLKDKEQPIITYCASGLRSASAKAILKSKGYKEVHNAMSWNSLARKLSA